MVWVANVLQKIKTAVNIDRQHYNITTNAEECQYIIHKIYLMYGKLMYNLYKIPSCKVEFNMLYYRQKEEG